MDDHQMKTNPSLTLKMPNAHFENENLTRNGNKPGNTQHIESQYRRTDDHLTDDYNHENLDSYQDIDVQKVLTHDGDPLINNKSQAIRAQISELDEEDDDTDVARVPSDNTGIDDGFLNPRVGADDDDKVGQTPQPVFPQTPTYNPNVIYDSSGRPQIVPDINVYQQKKNLAQGMMDLALFSANANQLRYVLESYNRHPYYWFSLSSITISLILQVAVGVGLILNSRYNVRNKEEICRADKINNLTILGIFLITIVNVFISAFGVADAP